MSIKNAFKRATPGLTADDAQDSPQSNGGSRAGSNAGSDVEAEGNAEKFLLRVTAGPSYDPSTHCVVAVNGPGATSFESDAMSTQIRVRIKGYRGLPRNSPDTSVYFSDPDHKSSIYSIAFSFVPKKDIPSANTVWGNDFDHPIRDKLPPGFSTAFRIVKQWIDPGLECDAQADNPWLYGPSLSCWFALNVGENGQTTARAHEMQDDHGIVSEGGVGSGATLRSDLGLPETAEKRRKYFLDQQHREKFTFEKGRLYQGDFHNPYLDFSNYGLKLPGFSIGVVRYLNDKTHSLRYVFKDRKTGEVFFVVVFTLLFGDELQHALDDDRKASETATRPRSSTLD